MNGRADPIERELRRTWRLLFLGQCEKDVSLRVKAWRGHSHRPRESLDLLRSLSGLVKVRGRETRLSDLFLGERSFTSDSRSGDRGHPRSRSRSDEATAQVAV